RPPSPATHGRCDLRSGVASRHPPLAPEPTHFTHAHRSSCDRREGAMDDPRWDDPRDCDEDSHDLDIHWIELGREGASDPRDDDPRDRDEDIRERDRDSRDCDPRDVFLYGLELPRGLEREVVID